LNNDLRKDYMAIADNLNKVGEKFKGSGVKFGYHNHAFEFELTEDGKVPLEILIENTDPELVTFQLDVYWVTNAGADPITLINKYPGRFSSFHIKDANDSLQQTTVGTGIIDFKSILGSQDVSKYTHYFVEDERADNPLDNLQADFDYVNSLEF
jgi:sugar phosphate isomerase/epimerase